MSRPRTLQSRIAPARSLPVFIPPMLATAGEAFDSDDYLFEIKWDGTRALLFVDDDHRYRLVNRRKIDLTARYPELAGPIGRLPAGTVLDGEIVVLGPDGKPDFSALQSREHARSGRSVQASKSRPATYIVFDQLHREYEPVMRLTFSERRAILTETIKAINDSRLVLSAGIVGSGKAYFEQACLECLEGVVAKRLSSPYLPGKRTDAWIKTKKQEIVHCVVIGFVPEGEDDFGALIIACEVGGEVRCAGKVGTGFDERRRRRINNYLWSHLRDDPVVAPGKYRQGARWVEPGLYCAVRCMERTAGGQLRAPAVVEVYDHA
jgi:bifunctional non-homologous end joining protein LigD